MTGIGAILLYQIPGIMDIGEQSDEEKKEEEKDEGEENEEELGQMLEGMDIEDDD